MNCNDLKSVYIDRTGDWVRSGNDTGKFYLKEEVDAVIAELKQKLEDAKATAYAESVDAGMEKRRLKQELRHHKYKRCLAMAKWCKLEQERIELIECQDITDDDFNKLVKGFYKKWHKRWLELAEKFKAEAW